MQFVFATVLIFFATIYTRSKCDLGTEKITVVFLASGQYTLSMRTYAPFRNVVRSNQRHDRKEGRKEEEELKNKRASEEKSKIIEGITEEDERKNNKRNKKIVRKYTYTFGYLKDHFANH